MNERTSFAAFREQPYRMTADEFLELATYPPLNDVSGKLELVDGVIVHVSPALNPHSRYQGEVFYRLKMAYGDETPKGWVVRVELTVRLNDHSTRDPDIAVLRNPGNDKGPGTPGDVLMLVEIAYTTLRTDLKAKRRNYAAAGIPHYWIVDVEGRETHVLSDPVDGDYVGVRIVPFGQDLAVPEAGKAIRID
jgi:Uma2 family endonuclease